MSRIILASASPRRSELLQNIGIEFIKYPAYTEEEIFPYETPEEGARRLALNKAEYVAGSCNYDEGIIIAADTIVVLEDKVLGKPGSAKEAYEMLAMLSGRSHQVITAVCLRDIKRGITLLETERTKVYFRVLEEGEIWHYIRTGEPMDKAGAYGIQGLGALFVERIEGCYFNVVGLPLYRLYLMLKQMGVNLLGG
ncbi:septum formation protein [Thermosyntropha lipolytica DSM 11003]|uniref:dTTP/UTP pyrophosphatase n=1 Tax=Thermosyntropha lipolytica DSM 11003 TaxID=1123382 RepID=A0A1M5MMD0_9FIRM|nr:Maf family protein [Thermosyntropha lipolytica]SHG78396.1 septum formation protein [Thermosyntropha lipolytica DSM 11003]